MVIRVDEMLEVKEVKNERKKEKEVSVQKTEFTKKEFERPEVINAKVYKLKSRYTKHNIYITIGYIEEDGRKKPYEMFINSKDLSKAAEFAVLTRLISAIFRKSDNPVFILEELRSIHDPNGGYLKEGKYIHSIYGEIAEVIEKFFEEIGLIKKERDETLIKFASLPNNLSHPLKSDNIEINEQKLKICPECNMKTLKAETGCFTCINPECNYSKCD